jgi:hypothetical protein
MKLVILLVAMTATLALCETAARADEFPQALTKASSKMSLTTPGSQPFHLKIHAAEKISKNPEYAAEIEVWWSAVDKWRRVVKSPAFSQTAVRNELHYYETNSADYLPWWLHELIQESIDPVPVQELENEDVDFSGNGCAKWQSEYSKDGQKAAISNTLCFNSDGTVKDLFVRNVGVSFGDYQQFGDKSIARSITAWPRGGAEVEGKVKELKGLNSSDTVFDTPSDSGFDARLRFVSVPETAVEVDKDRTAPLKWPVIHNFPASGIMAVNLKIDRDGNVQEVGSVITNNVVLQDSAREQIRNWKFKPYRQDGNAVQVNTYLAVPYEAKVELLGTNAKSLPVESFFSRIEKSRKLSDPRTERAAPFHLTASVKTRGGLTAIYEEIWITRTRWRRQVQVGLLNVVRTQSGENLFQKSFGPEPIPKFIDFVFESVADRFPRTDGWFIEGDWGQSAVSFDRLDTVRIARGAVDKKNQPTSGHAYWFDSTGLLRGAYVQPQTMLYRGFALWNEKQIPRKLELIENGGEILSITIEQIEDTKDKPDSMFALVGVRPLTVAREGE